ncbi:MAG: TlpA family protein disulfide reductase [Solirubrobacteraceae bacterium]
MPLRRPSRTVALRAAVVAAVAVAAVLFAVRGSSSPPPPGITTSPQAWTLPRLGGTGTVALHDLRGHPVVVDFFASWCTACRGELPGMAAVSATLRGRVTFVGVDSEETGNGLAMAQQLGVAWWPLASDSGGVDGSGLHDALGAKGMPLTAFYDSSGRLLRVTLGAICEADLSSVLQTLFGVS